MRLSLHATKRWRERCPDLEPFIELRTARAVSKRLRRILRDPNYAGVAGKHEPQVMRYMITENHVVLVVTPDDHVLTVFTLAEAKRWHQLRHQTLIKVKRGLLPV